MSVNFFASRAAERTHPEMPKCSSSQPVQVGRPVTDNHIACTSGETTPWPSIVDPPSMSGAAIISSVGTNFHPTVQRAKRSMRERRGVDA
ncbi:hypothetical protein ACFQHV_19340 [Promicromonospora thailandica]|uniref:hypothetical protein n=1 Tax=Promicromonospora thailandica TaxID=765201 RepID=UPI0020A2BF69|nr:hypothetical protein [Promicromonospora thailandica]